LKTCFQKPIRTNHTKATRCLCPQGFTFCIALDKLKN